MSESDLHSFVDGMLGFERRHEVIDHLSSRPDAARRVDEYLLQTGRIRELGNLLDFEDSDSFCPDLQRRLVQERAKKNAVWPRYVAIAASVAVLITASIAAYHIVPERGGEGRSVADAVVESDALVIERTMVVENAASSGARLKAELPSVGKTIPVESTDSPVAWLTRHMVDHALTKPELDEIGLRFVNGKVLTDTTAPSIQLVYEDAGQNEVFIYAGLLPGGAMEPAFATVPEGHLSLHWRRGPLLFALIAPTESPQLDKMVRLVSAGLAHVPEAPVESVVATAPKSSEMRKAARLAEGGALVIPFDMVIGHSIAIPMRRPDYHLRIGEDHGANAPIQPISIGENKPESL
ncbi:MAG: hypothetical protein R3C97_02565 [Geminicoccaceae bacterium]